MSNRNGQNEAADTLEERRATYAEIFPHRNPEAMRVDDADLALAVMIRRRVMAAEKRQPAARPLEYTGNSV